MIAAGTKLWAEAVKFSGIKRSNSSSSRRLFMKSIKPIIIAGGGPVGVIAALAFARQDIPVQVFEAESRVNDNPRAATTHPATLAMLEDLGLVEEVTRRGLIEPKFRIWDRTSREIIVEFDFGLLKEDTRFPYVVQCEQHKLAEMAIARLKSYPTASMQFSGRVSERPCRQRPCRRAEPRDEFPPVHSITSSARSKIDGGTARPSALAVLRFTIISNLVGN